MDIEDIKVGETYNVRVKIIEKYGDCVDAIYAEYDTIEGIHIPKRRIGILHPISPENGTKNTETAPKYDPNRKFKKGDIVEPCKVKGRWLYGEWETLRGVRFIVMSDEADDDGLIIVQRDASKRFKIVEAVFFQLVTPVEELEPYIVTPSSITGAWRIVDTRIDATVATIFKAHPNAKATAEAECARLNAEHRKEGK